MGKPMGNGMPIAGVAARPEILAEFGHKIRYFNTFGGNSVSIAAAAAVLDVIETEGLRGNARVVGRYLRDTLADIASGTPRIAAAAIKFADPGRTTELRHRYLALILDGMRATDRGDLPGPPPDWPELSERWNASSAS